MSTSRGGLSEPFSRLTVCAACRKLVGLGELRGTGGTHPIVGEPW